MNPSLTDFIALSEFHWLVQFRKLLEAPILPLPSEIKKEVIVSFLATELGCSTRLYRNVEEQE